MRTPATASNGPKPELLPHAQAHPLPARKTGQFLMRTSIRGHLLPESEQDAKLLFSQKLHRHAHCAQCHQPLDSPTAAHTPLGWAETQISGICEPCFDEIFNDGATS